MTSQLRDFIPDAAIRTAKIMLRRGICFEGDYETWYDAEIKAGGYASPEISERALDAALAVARGTAAFERDGVTFAEHDPPFPLLAALLRIATENGGRLSVLDFGGGMGSQFQQCYPWIKKSMHLKWQVVEQPTFVRLGRENLETDYLSFQNTIDEAFAIETPNVALFSSVLQYVESPYELLMNIASNQVSNVIVDRTPFIGGKRSKIAVQRVPSRIVSSSYPVHLFSKFEFLTNISDCYDVECDFSAVDGRMGGPFSPIDFMGLYLRRI